MSFSPEQLEQQLGAALQAPCLWVAYSGGCDSHALLHAIHALQAHHGFTLRAIHINHGLSPLADAWEDHCLQVCTQLDIPYTAVRVDARQKDRSPEEAAREARYAEWRKLLQQDEVLLLAHHQDDQVETLMLQLLRGAGVKGLAAMPAEQAFAAGRLLRPMLGFLREEIVSYASAQNLNWIDDPSNFDTDFDRNFLRHEVIPLLQSRWPGMKTTLARSARHMGEANSLLDELARGDWETIRKEKTIVINKLKHLSKVRQKNVLRYWAGEIHALLMPGTVHLQRILDEVLDAADDAMPEVSWPGGVVRRFQGCLYAEALRPHDVEQVISWPDLARPLRLPGGEMLQASEVIGRGLSQKILANAHLEVRFRQGGERCRPVGRGQTHQLKKLFQEWQVPPWRRNRVPLLYANGELAEVVGYCHCEPFAATDAEPGWQIQVLNT